MGKLITGIVTSIIVSLFKTSLNSLGKYLKAKETKADYAKYITAESAKKGLENVLNKAERTKGVLTHTSSNPFDRLRSFNKRGRTPNPTPT